MKKKKAFTEDPVDSVEVMAVLRKCRVPQEVFQAMQRLESGYRRELEQSVAENVHAAQREELLREQLRLAEGARDELQAEGTGAKSEWEQMYAELKDARQQVAVLDARNKFLEKADEARRLLHVDLRDTQRRLAESRDAMGAVQQAAASRQLELEEHVHDLTVIQDELGHLLRQERLKSETRSAELANAKGAAASSNARVAALLDEKSVFEDEVDKLAAALHETLVEKTVLAERLISLQRQFLEAKQDAAAKIAELVNNVDTLVSVTRQYGRNKVRSRGGFEELGTVLQRECRREIERRAALVDNALRYAAKAKELAAAEAAEEAAVTKAAAMGYAQKREDQNFIPFGKDALYTKLKDAAVELSRHGLEHPSGALPEHPWGHRILFRPETAPIWTSVAVGAGKRRASPRRHAARPTRAGAVAATTASTTATGARGRLRPSRAITGAGAPHGVNTGREVGMRPAWHATAASAAALPKQQRREPSSVEPPFVASTPVEQGAVFSVAEVPLGSAAEAAIRAVAAAEVGTAEYSGATATPNTRYQAMSASTGLAVLDSDDKDEELAKRIAELECEHAQLQQQFQRVEGN
eukprot:SAG11_NODE_1483_length_4829_cov_5.725793_1_plen_585_part_00